MITIQELKGIALFQDLSFSTQEVIARVCIQRSYGRGELIQIVGDPCEAVYFIRSGVVQVLRSSPEGREQVLEALAAGGVFNIVPPLTNLPQNRASARAVSDVHLIVMKVDEYQMLLENNNEFANQMLKEFARRLSHLTDLVENLSLYPVRARLARFLLRTADQQQINVSWTQDEIAAQLGTVRDVIGRTLRTFEDACYLRREREKILLIDRAGLESEADLT